MKTLSRLSAIVLAGAFLFTACSGGSSGASQSTESTASQASQTSVASASESAAPSGNLVEVTIPHYKSGENVGAKFFLPQVERFNAKYEGQYKINIEQIPNDMYNEKIKQLGQQNKLPVLIEGGEKTWLEEVVIPGGQFYDLNALLERNPDMKKLLLEDNLAHNSKSGKLFSITMPVVRPMTLFYNGALFTPSKPFSQLSWEELCNELGDRKIAFMTGENAWTTSLALSSMIAVQPGGADLLIKGVEEKITDFNQEPIIKAFEQLQGILQNYASSNTVGATYADAANSFMSGNSVIICNGSWMTGDFTPESTDKWSGDFNGADVRGDVLPGNVGLANTLGYGWWIPANATEEEAQLAMAFIEFMNTPEELEAYMLAEGGTAPNLTYSEEFLAKRAEDKLLDEYVGAVTADTLIVPAFNDAIPSSLADTELGKLLPKLIDGSLDATAFCAELTKKAAESMM